MNNRDELAKKRIRLIIIVLIFSVANIAFAVWKKDMATMVLVIINFVLLMSVMIDFYFNIIKMRHVEEKQNQSERKLMQAELEKEKQQLRALESQINPHFLYNTLDSFRGLALEQGNKELSDMIEALSFMFKYSVKYDDEMVSVNAELDYLKRYIQLQQMRFPNRFIYEENIECPTSQLLLQRCPRFVLQPIVENAIRHGLKDVRKEGRITVSMGFRNSIFWILVEDNGCGIDMTEVSLLNQRLSHMSADEDIFSEGRSTGIGIANVNRRIKMFCGEEYGLKMKSTTGVGTQVEVSLPPYREAKEEMEKNNI